jgi:hypothetical protein
MDSTFTTTITSYIKQGIIGAFLINYQILVPTIFWPDINFLGG